MPGLVPQEDPDLRWAPTEPLPQRTLLTHYISPAPWFPIITSGTIILAAAGIEGFELATTLPCSSIFLMRKRRLRAVTCQSPPSKEAVEPRS